MKKTTLILVILLTAFTVSYAQDNQSDARVAAASKSLNEAWNQLKLGNMDKATAFYEVYRKYSGKTDDFFEATSKELSIINLYNKGTRGIVNDHTWVDMGLSVMWATCNVGAASETEPGNSYAWGEVKSKSSYSQETLVNNIYNSLEISGNVNHDAAAKYWGGTWRMPSSEEIEELIGHTRCEWVCINGQYGNKLTSTINGESIFFPAAGYYKGSTKVRNGVQSGYWSGSGTVEDNKYYGHCLIVDQTDIGTNCYSTWPGFNIRPVTKKKAWIDENILKKIIKQQHQVNSIVETARKNGTSIKDAILKLRISVYFDNASDIYWEQNKIQEYPYPKLIFITQQQSLFNSLARIALEEDLKIVVTVGIDNDIADGRSIQQDRTNFIDNLLVSNFPELEWKIEVNKGTGPESYMRFE